MILWRVFGAVFGVWNVFQSSGLDFRLVALGSVLPLLVDAPSGVMSYGHTLVLAAAALTVAMAVTAGRGHRLRRRRALSLVIGWFAGLVLGGAWAHHELFWWPLFGGGRPSAPLLPPAVVVVVLEAIGAAAAWWAWKRFGLADAHRRARFARTGRLDVAAGG